MIHVTDSKSDDILAVVTQGNVMYNNHKQSIKDYLETFDFEVFGDKAFVEHLSKRNRVIIPDEDEGYKEFIIHQLLKEKGGQHRAEVYTVGSYLELKKAKVIDPIVLTEYTPTMHVSFATNGTEWRPGIIEGSGYRTQSIETPTNPFEYLKRIANEFGLELRFRVETDGNKVTGRYVDLLERNGAWNGREVTFGKDLQNIRRKEDFSNIYTALKGIGPEREDGTRLEVVVEDEDALQRWGRPDPLTGRLQHLIDSYEPQSERAEMTEEELIRYTRTELNKRINSVVEYEVDVVDLENVPGMENKKIRFGDTIRIKDEKFNPALYLEARVHTQERDIFTKANKKIELGDYIEYTEEEVNAIWQQLQKAIQRKISMSDLLEVTYTKDIIDQKDVPGNQAKDKLDREVGEAVIETTTGSSEKAQEAEGNAKDYVDLREIAINEKILEKADLTYVDGQLAFKADSEVVQTINNTVEGLEQTTSDLLQSVADNLDALEAQGGRITTVETNLDEVEGQLSLALNDLSTLSGTVSQHGTQISANTEAIGLKASQSDLDTLSGDVSSISGQLTVMSGEIEAKAERSELESLEGNVTTISNDLASLSVAYDGITADIQSIEAITDGLTTDITNLNTDIQAVAGEVSTKVSAEYVTGAIADIEIGGRNLIQDSVSILIPEKTGTEYNYITIHHGLKKNTTYTISFEAEFIKGSATHFSIYPYINGSQNMSRIDEIYIDGERFICTFTTDNRYNYNLLVYAGRAGATLGNEVLLKEVQLEVGNKASSWRPAPEDVQAEIDSVYQYASSEFSQLPGKLALKADATVVDGIESRVSTAELNIDSLEGEISSKVSDSDFNGNTIASLINQTATTVSIHASKINLVGAVTVLSDITDSLGTITAGTIKGVNIEGATITQSASRGSIVLNNSGLTLSSTSGSRIVMSISDIGFGEGDDLAINFYNQDNELGLSIYDYYTDSVLDTNKALILRSGFQGIELDARKALSDYGVNLNGGLRISNGFIMTGAVDTNATHLYGRVSSSGEFRVTRTGTTNVWQPIHAAEGRFEGFLSVGGAIDHVYGGGTNLYLRTKSGGEIQATRNGTTSTYVPVRASSFPTGSLAEYKQDIVAWEDSALDIIQNTTIYQYRLKDNLDKLRYGLVIGDGYKTPKEVIDGDGVEQYLMNSIGWKAIQELSGITSELADDINFLKMKNQYLQGKIEELERKIA